MLQVINATPFATGRAVLLSAHGEHIWTVAIKATYRIEEDGKLSLAEQPEPVFHHAVYLGAPGASSLVRDAELVVEHPGTAITLNAKAYAPSGRPEYSVDVAVGVGQIQHQLKIIGDRTWQPRLLGGVHMSDPQRFIDMPICYERAFGGVDPGTRSAAPQNPVGTGYASSARAAKGVRLPNVELPTEPIERPDRHLPPAGFGAIAPSWTPRKELGGTADEQWAQTRAPLWPADWSPWHCNAAPKPLQSPTKLRGGERVVLVNLSSRPRLEFSLPRVFFDVRTKLSNGSVSNEVGLDRVIIEPEHRRLVMVWRSALNCGPDARRVSTTYVDTKRDIHTGRNDGTA